ncbi:hypothetical protein BFP70_03935 [Thioclava sp. SK-1]|uniref:YrhK family protein n=1 Tax=Thioclava sp. SK-1 TaxID=1889770 RepID=UPI0008271E1C|nr:YrhK family protein [Thioclava sp. SK-1]OCX66978.1 hypothetical protein BFP70_03935 [Thioclava sp. SK-1]
MQQLFHYDQQHGSPRKRRIYAAYELLYTAVDFGAALCFVIGSVMFFSDSWMTPGTWLFLIGSILFAFKPTIRLIREIRLVSMGDVGDVAQKQTD